MSIQIFPKDVILVNIKFIFFDFFLNILFIYQFKFICNNSEWGKFLQNEKF